MLVVGIILGLGCAILQSGGYIFSRRFVLRHPGGPVRLLVMVHVIMGVVAAAMLPLFWPDHWPSFSDAAGPFAQMVLFYLAGQLLLLITVRKTEASRVSPLLGLKILILAVWVAVMDVSPGLLQWAAVALSVGAAALLGLAGGRISGRAMILIVVTCICYSLSDLGIKYTVDVFNDAHTGTNTAILVFCLCYALCGLAATALLPWLGDRRRAVWVDAAPFAFAWLGAMMMFFGCIAIVGPLYGNILQAARGVLSVAIGALVARAGWLHLEQRIGRAAWVRRAAAAVLMFAAIALYFLAEK